MESTKSAFSPSDIKALHGLRALAVLLVFLDHGSARWHIFHKGADFVGIGKAGVYLFFLLSSFLLTQGLLVDGVKPKYFAKRLLRIVPLYYLTLGGVAILQYFYGGPWKDVVYVENDAAKGFWKHLTFQYGEFLLWTMPVEFRAYFLLPIYVLLLNKWKWPTLLAGGVFGILYFASFYGNHAFGQHHFLLHWFMWMRDLQFYDVFLIGVGLVLIKDWGAKIRLFGSQYFGIFWLFLILLGTWVGMARTFFVWEYQFMWVYWASLPYALLWSVLILCILAGSPLLNEFLRNRFLVEIGKASYSWYLLHFFVFAFVNALIPKEMRWGPVKIFLSATICYFAFKLTYRYVEKPFLKLFDKSQSGKI